MGLLCVLSSSSASCRDTEDNLELSTLWYNNSVLVRLLVKGYRTEEVKTMKYDPNNRKFFFNEEKILSSESAAACRQQFDSWQKESISNITGVIADSMRDQNGMIQGSKVLGSLGALSVLIGIIAIAMSFIIKRYDVGAWIISAICAFLGAVMFFGPTGRETSKFYEEGSISQRIQGLILLIGAIIIVMLRLSTSDPLSVRFVISVLFALALTLFMAMVIKCIGYKNSGNSVYREEVEAKVIGYVRTYEAYDEMSVSSLNSPVFEYYYGGSKYQSYLDIMDNGDNGQLEVGSTCKIKISPEDPEKVMGNTKNIIDGPVVFAILCFVAAVIFLILML